jgi:hypothetical protein
MTKEKTKVARALPTHGGGTSSGSGMSRRAMLGVLGTGAIAGVGFVTGCSTSQPGESGGGGGGRPTNLARWSDPATWGGKVPGAGDRATVTRPVLLDVDARVKGVLIQAGGQLVFDPATTHTLTSTANVVVQGTLRMRPSSAGVQHLLVFAGVNEARFVGGPSHAVVDSDVGLWITGAGVLDAVGSSKTAWTHLAAATAAGAGSITVDQARNWRVGDEIVVTPTERHDYGDHFKHHDRRKIKAISGTTVTLDRALSYAHPFVTVKPGVTHKAEVLNLTRNVRIEGTATGRAHVMQLHGTKPQTLGWLALRYMGPRQVLGRYALHIHMAGDGSRGSTVTGAVAADSANHAFVPHLSNGIGFTDCLVHDSLNDAFWWDLAGDGQESGDVPSHDILWDRCVASFIQHLDGEEAHSNSGFSMGAGKGNVARRCVATGVSGRSEGATGFQWGAGSNDETNPWVFEDNLAHNNTHSGLFYWQNNAPKTTIDRFTAYNCGQGIYAGSYINLVSYRDCTVYGCADWGLNVRATPSGVSGPTTITYDGMYIDQAGRGEYAVLIQEHTLSDDKVTVFTKGTFKGATKAQVGFPSGGELRQMYDFVDCTFSGNALWVARGVPANSQIRLIRSNVGSVSVHPTGGPGTAKPAWNATATPA